MNTSVSASHAAFGYVSKYTLRLRRKTKDSPQVEGVKLPSEGFAGAFKAGNLQGSPLAHPFETRRRYAMSLYILQ